MFSRLCQKPSIPSALMIALLEWLAARPRTYSETMEAWRTSCPRMPVWEDTMDRELIQVVYSPESTPSRSPIATGISRIALDAQATCTAEPSRIGSAIG